MADDTASGSAPVARTRVRLTDISSRAWEHPADRGALVALRQLKGFDIILRRLAGLWNERALRMVYVGTAVRCDERQFADVHRALLDVAVSLDVKDVPELFVVASPARQAMAIGVDKPFIVITSGLVDLLDEEELRFVVGHELGHILSGHALYTTMLMQLLRVSNSLNWLSFGALGLRAVLAALHEWARKAELSGDRAGLLAVQDPSAALRTHMKLAGGGHLADLDITAFTQQGEEYLTTTDLRDSILKMLLLEARTHPFAVVRNAELRRWVDSGEYTKILQGHYPRRTDDKDAKLKDGVSDAASHYKDAFENSQDPLLSLVKDIGGVVTGAGSWVADRFRSANRGSSGADG